jgi:hypothetical protein
MSPVAATQGSFAGGAWQVGALAPGAAASLRLDVLPTAAGAQLVVAEVAASAVHDPDSVPGNGALEDDRSGVVIVTPAVQALPPVVRPLPRGLALRAVRAPKRGVAKRITVTGSLLLPKVRPVPRCRGRVQVRARVGKRTVAVRTVPLRARRAQCRYAAQLRPTRARTKAARRVVVSARFLGTPQMRPRASRNVPVRIR